MPVEIKIRNCTIVSFVLLERVILTMSPKSPYFKFGSITVLYNVGKTLDGSVCWPP